MKKLHSLAVLALAVSLPACTRITTGEAGVRYDFNKQVEMVALKEGTWHQTIIGSVLKFPVKEVGLSLDNRKPLTVENTPLGELDAVLTYNIHPDMVPELWSQRSKSFHLYHESDHEYHLMEGYITTMADNAILKVIRQYKQLEVNDNRQKIEQEILAALREDLKTEKLEGAITFNHIQVKNLRPNQQVLDSALQVVTTQNALKVKQNEVAIAEQEAKRMAALANQGSQSIAYMQAQAQLNISEGVKNGKVNTIVVPADFKGFVSTGK